MNSHTIALDRSMYLSPQKTMEIVLDTIREIIPYDLAVILSKEVNDHLKVRYARGPLVSEKLQAYEFELKDRPDIAGVLADGNVKLVAETHDPGHHDTRAHYGVRTDTHKLIHFWKLDQWELYDLANDPDEMKNLYGAPAAQPVVADLKARLARLKQELGDTDQFTTSLPRDTVDARPKQLDKKHPNSQL